MLHGCYRYSFYCFCHSLTEVISLPALSKKPANLLLSFSPPTRFRVGISRLFSAPTPLASPPSPSTLCPTTVAHYTPLELALAVHIECELWTLTQSPHRLTDDTDPFQPVDALESASILRSFVTSYISTETDHLFNFEPSRSRSC